MKRFAIFAILALLMVTGCRHTPKKLGASFTPPAVGAYIGDGSGGWTKAT